MSISIASRPFPLSWSKNAIQHGYFYTLPITGDRVYVQLQNGTTGAVLTELSYPLDASVTSGTQLIRSEEQMDATLSWGRPGQITPGLTAQLINECLGNIGSYKQRFRAAPLNYTPVVWQNDSTILRVIKGGLGDMTFTGEDQINSGSHSAVSLPTNGRFLTWVPKNRFQAPGEWGWLLFLCTETDQHRVSYYMNYADGSFSIISRLFNAVIGSSYQYRNFWIPTGILQAALDPAGKGVTDYGIVVEKPFAGVWTTVDSYDIQVDNRPTYDGMTLYYRNSMGGWDNLLLRGEKDWSSDVERKEADDYGMTNGRLRWYDTSIRPKWKVTTGYLSREHFTALNDLFMSRDAALLYNGQWLPVRVTSTSHQYFSTRNALGFTQIELEAAGSFKSFPKQLMALR